MDKMRADMGGAACTIGSLLVAASLQLPINIKGEGKRGSLEPSNHFNTCTIYQILIDKTVRRPKYWVS